MKTNILKNFRGKYLGILAILGVSLSACGGSAGGDGTIDRPPTTNLSFNQVQFISPAAGQTGVCPNLVLQMKINGLENCGINLADDVRIYRPGGSEYVQFGQLDARPLPAENKCLLSGQVINALIPGQTYRATVASSMNGGQVIQGDFIEFSTISQADLNSNPAACTNGSFDVYTVNGGNDFQHTNLNDFGTVQSNGTVDFSQEALDLLYSSLINILRDSFMSQFFGLGARVFDPSPAALHAYRFAFTQDVSDASIGNIDVYQVSLFDPGETPIFTRVDSYVERINSSEYRVRPWNRASGSDEGWAPGRTYVILVKRSIASTHGLNMSQSVIKIFTTAQH